MNTQEFPVAHYLGVIINLNDFGVTCLSSANLFVSRVSCLTVTKTTSNRTHTFHAPKKGFSAPIAPTTKSGDRINLFNLLERYRVNAVTKTTWCWAIWENMSEMCLTSITQSFDARHSHRIISMIRDRIFLRRLRERRPTSPTVKFLTSIK